MSKICLLYTSRFYDKFDFTDGFVPVKKVAANESNHVAAVTGSHKINVLIASPLTVKKMCIRDSGEGDGDAHLAAVALGGLGDGLYLGRGRRAWGRCV